MQVLRRRDELGTVGAGVVVVGFSPPRAMAELARHLDLPWPVLSDHEMVLYRLLELQRGSLLRVYSGRTLRRYASALVQRQTLHRPVEDTRQLGADAIVTEGRVVRLYRPQSPDDRPSVDAILAALREVAE